MHFDNIEHVSEPVTAQYYVTPHSQYVPHSLRPQDNKSAFANSAKSMIQQQQLPPPQPTLLAKSQSEANIQPRLPQQPGFMSLQKQPEFFSNVISPSIRSHRPSASVVPPNVRNIINAQLG